LPSVNTFTKKTGGRQVGTPNKVTTIFKDAVRTVYEDIGGHAAFANWAKEHPTDFYRIAARLIPTETTSKEDTNLTIEIVKFSPEEEVKH
jgi:hypothetical protein